MTLSRVPSIRFNIPSRLALRLAGLPHFLLRSIGPLSLEGKGASFKNGNQEVAALL
ncbi:hypothetical protein PUATCC27989T_02726 [Phytobacter ursingii]|nr:hypothetical protein TUM17576_19860 [Enterobacter hormaechei]VTP14856.1 hypothetical protein PUATCC27989T_02726 [Phytobacter ursingii]